MPDRLQFPSRIIKNILICDLEWIFLTRKQKSFHRFPKKSPGYLQTGEKMQSEEWGRRSKFVWFTKFEGQKENWARKTGVVGQKTPSHELPTAVIDDEPTSLLASQPVCVWLTWFPVEQGRCPCGKAWAGFQEKPEKIQRFPPDIPPGNVRRPASA